MPPEPTETPVEVLWPSGPATLHGLASADRFTDLDGLRLAFVWDRIFRGDEMFAAIETAVARQARDATFVPHTEFGDIHGADERAVVEALPDRLLEHRVVAGIVGVGA